MLTSGADVVNLTSERLAAAALIVAGSHGAAGNIHPCVSRVARSLRLRSSSSFSLELQPVFIVVCFFKALQSAPKR